MNRQLNSVSGVVGEDQLLTNGRETKNWYVFLVKENEIWKLSAIRTLALPKVNFIVLQQLEQEGARTQEEEWKYQNMLLTIKSDSNLKTYLKENITDFKNVVTLLTEDQKREAETIFKRLFINFVNVDNGIVEFNIGGILDNLVGYLFVPPGKNPPEMNPGEYIYLERINPGWYVFKTT